MSRLLNPGPGDIADRLTILALKILHASADRSEHFVVERNGLLTKIRSSTLNGAWFEHVLSLGAVNAALWQLEDRIRAMRHAEVDLADVAQVAFRIADLNDERARLVRTINELTGDQWIEKL